MKKPLSLPKGERSTSAPKGKRGAAAPTAGRPVRDTKQSAVRRAFFTRGMHLMKRLAKETPEDVLTEALGKATVLDTVATAMTGLVARAQPLDARDQRLAAARARGVQYMDALLERAGGAYTAQQLAEVLGKDGGRQTVAAGRARNVYFGLPTAAGAFAYPKLQVAENGKILTGLQAFLDAFDLPNAWVKLAVLLEPSPRLGGRSPLEALKAGGVEQAVQVAAAYGSHGA